MLKRVLLAGVVAVSGSLAMPAPAPASPLIVFGDDGEECPPPVFLWVDPASPFAFAIDPTEECESEPFTGIVFGRRGRLGAAGAGVGLGLMGAFGSGGLSDMWHAASSSGAPPEWLTITGPPFRAPLAPPAPIAIGGGAFPDLVPIRESSWVDVVDLTGSERPGVLHAPVSLPFELTAAGDGQRLVELHVLTSVDSAVVPEPGSLALVGTGLLMAARRMRKTRGVPPGAGP